MSSSQGVVIASNQTPVSVAGTINVGNLPANQSVSGAVAVNNFPLTQNVAGSVAATQGTTPWVITGSVQASLTPAANQSVSGTVQTDVRGSVATVIIGGSIAASFTPPANQSVSGAVSISNFPTTQNVSGSVIAQVSNYPTNQNISGSVAAWLQSTNASVITVGSPVVNQSVSGTVGASVLGHAPVFIVGGSILTSSTPNQSVSGTVSVGNFPLNQNVSGSVVATQGTNPWIITGSVQASLTPAANQSVSGTVGTSVIGHAPVVIVGGSILTASTPNQSVSGTVNAAQIGTQITSVSSGQVSVFQAGAWTTSVVGNLGQIGTRSTSVSGVAYPEDAAHTSGQIGVFTLAVRNDTVSSFTGANTRYSPLAVDNAGRALIKPFAGGEASLIANTSLVSAGTTASVVLFGAPGAGLKNYITDFNISNTGATGTLVIFADGDGSVIGRTIAPAGGGSNHSYTTPIPNTRANTPINIQLGSSSSVVFATVTGFRAP